MTATSNHEAELLAGVDIPEPVERPGHYYGITLFALRDADGAAVAVWDGNGKLRAIRSGLAWSVHDAAASTLGSTIHVLETIAGSREGSAEDTPPCDPVLACGPNGACDVHLNGGRGGNG